MTHAKTITPYLLTFLLLAPGMAIAEEAREGEPSVLIATADNYEAARILKRFLKKQGFDLVEPSTEQVESPFFGVRKQKQVLLLSSHVSAETLDLIMVSSRLVEQTKAENRAKIRTVVEKLNRNFVQLKFVLNEDHQGALFCFMPVTFVDRLTLAELEAAIEFMAEAPLAAARWHTPELFPLL